MKEKLIKAVRYAIPIVSLGVALLTDWANDKKMEEKIEEKVNEAFAKTDEEWES